jgi:RNA polymerase sigma-70 factor (ECF subfamily)
VREAARAAEQAARTSYGRLVAILAARTRDVAAAEDALAEAFGAALASWPQAGVPDRPEAWLLTAARRVLGHGHRHAQVRAGAAQALHLLAEEAEARMAAEPFPDERLKLLFVCAHPAIDRAVHTPLMLQTVLGLDAARIASAFATTPAAMGQRLVRAKAKIRDAGIAFAVPGPEELAARLDPVLEAIYAAYTAGWDDPAHPGGLTGEAAWLADLTAALLPGEAEALGLLALLLHCQARAAARRDAAGGFVPLDRQDTGRWDGTLIRRAEITLGRAFALGRIGHFQIEAAIQSAHAARAFTGTVDWAGVARLYEALVQLAPGLGAQVGRAAAIGEATGAAAGLAALEAIAAADYQPWWAVRAHLLHRLGRAAEAADAYRRAGELAGDPAVREFLFGRAAGR